MSAPQTGAFQLGSAIWPGLAKLLEEAGEVSQVIGKLIATGGREAHWDGTNLRERLLEELADLDAALTFVLVNNFTADERGQMGGRVSEKLAKFAAWARGDDV